VHEKGQNLDMMHSEATFDIDGVATFEAYADTLSYTTWGIPLTMAKMTSMMSKRVLMQQTW